ncbi:hypothetical protein ACET98_22635 [Aeromonas veronii]
MDPNRSGQWWNGGWQRWGESEWEGEKTSNFRSDDRGSITLIEKSKGHWIENEICEKPNDILANGVFLWTETKGTGHAFVSVHKDWSMHVYTYGRFDGNPISPVGDGVLIQYSFTKAREYYQHELYSMSARVFKIMDVDEGLTLAIFQKKWLSSSTQPDKDKIKETGRVINKYDLTGSNCTTTSVDALKLAGTNAFTVNGPIRNTYTEDFVIPSSLERHLSQLASSSDMLVVEVTSAMKAVIPNGEGSSPMKSAGPIGETLGSSGNGSGVAGSSSSGVSPGTFGGSLGSSND